MKISAAKLNYLVVRIWQPPYGTFYIDTYVYSYAYTFCLFITVGDHPVSGSSPIGQPARMQQVAGSRAERPQ